MGDIICQYDTDLNIYLDARGDVDRSEIRSYPAPLAVRAGTERTWNCVPSRTRTLPSALTVETSIAMIHLKS